MNNIKYILAQPMLTYVLNISGIIYLVHRDNHNP